MSDIAPHVVLPYYPVVGVLRLDGTTLNKLFEMGAGTYDELMERAKKAADTNNYVYFFYDVPTGMLIRSET